MPILLLKLRLSLKYVFVPLLKDLTQPNQKKARYLEFSLFIDTASFRICNRNIWQGSVDCVCTKNIEWVTYQGSSRRDWISISTMSALACDQSWMLFLHVDQCAHEMLFYQNVLDLFLETNSDEHAGNGSWRLHKKTFEIGYY